MCRRTGPSSGRSCDRPNAALAACRSRGAGQLLDRPPHTVDVDRPDPMVLVEPIAPVGPPQAAPGPRRGSAAGAGQPPPPSANSDTMPVRLASPGGLRRRWRWIRRRPLAKLVTPRIRVGGGVGRRTRQCNLAPDPGSPFGPHAEHAGDIDRHLVGGGRTPEAVGAHRIGRRRRVPFDADEPTVDLDDDMVRPHSGDGVSGPQGLGGLSSTLGRWSRRLRGARAG